MSIDSETLRARKAPRQIVEGLLERNEKLLWYAQPVARYLLLSGVRGDSRPARWLFLLVGLLAIQPFSLAGLYFAWTSLNAIAGAAGPLAILADAVMLLLGIALGFGPYVYFLRPRINGYLNADCVYYVITSRRVMRLLIRQGRVVDHKARYLNNLTEPWIRMRRANGVGDVIYASGGALHQGGDGSSDYSSHYDIGFEGVADASAVLERLREAIAGYRGQG